MHWRVCACLCYFMGGTWDAELVLAGLKGTRRGLEGTRGVLKAYSRICQAVLGFLGMLRLMRCTLVYLGGPPRKCVRACVLTSADRAVHL